MTTASDRTYARAKADLAGQRSPHDTPLLRRIRESVIGDDHLMQGPFGPRRVTYADYTASGRALGAELLGAALPPDLDAHDERLSADFEHLRWFELPAESLGALVPAR